MEVRTSTHLSGSGGTTEERKTQSAQEPEAPPPSPILTSHWTSPPGKGLTQESEEPCLQGLPTARDTESSGKSRSGSEGEGSQAQESNLE